MQYTDPIHYSIFVVISTLCLNQVGHLQRFHGEQRSFVGILNISIIITSFFEVGYSVYYSVITELWVGLIFMPVGLLAGVFIYAFTLAKMNLRIQEALSTWSILLNPVLIVLLFVFQPSII